MKFQRKSWYLVGLAAVACLGVARLYQHGDFVMAWASRLWSCW